MLFSLITLCLIIAILVIWLLVRVLKAFVGFDSFKNFPKNEGLFILFFLVLLFLPMLKIDKSDFSEFENRFLAKSPSLFDLEHKINFNFAKDFDKWFEDRFFLRKYYISLFYRVMYINKIVQTPFVFFDTKTNFMFFKTDYLIEDFDLIKSNLEKFDSFCRQNNIKLYTLIAPVNSEIYYDKINGCFDKNKIAHNVDGIYNLKNNTNIPIIFPYNELKYASKKDYTHFKADHHWTDLGAYIGYSLLMQEITKDFPKIKISKIEDYSIFQNKRIRSDYDRDFFMGRFLTDSLYAYQYNRKKILDTEYKYFNHKNYYDLITNYIDVPYYKEVESTYQNGAKYRVLLIGTSLSENLRQFVQYTFKDFKYIRLNNVKQIKEKDNFKIMKYYKDEILDFKPDIIIFCISMENLNQIKNIFNEED